MLLPITLTIAAAAALVNIWLSVRIGRVRMAERISVGDGGNENVIRRMRAQANFVENAPFVLILIGAIELSGRAGWWLWVVGLLFIVGRIAHGFGMDGGTLARGRMVGTIITMLTLLGLALYAIYITSVAPIA